MKHLEEMQNIGPRIADALRDVGILSPEDLRQAGAAAAFKKLQSRSTQRLPACYYLYSLEGALTDMPWRSIGREKKETLLKATGRL